MYCLNMHIQGKVKQDHRKCAKLHINGRHNYNAQEINMR